MNNRGITDLIINILPGLKTGEKIKIIESINNEDELLLNSKKDIEQILNREIKQIWDINELRDRAGRIDTICAMRLINWVSLASLEYPPLLREIYDPPAVLFYKGCLPNPEKSLLGMVGTRKPSPEARLQARKTACGIGRAGISVISGLAYGIDAMSHIGNLDGGVPGYAVLGSGADEIYPVANRSLAKRILDSGGAVISEYAPGVQPAKWRFPARNRIISGLSRSVLIVEAPEKSGALITAAFALEQGKELWVASSGIMPSKNFDKQGTMKLREDGAEIISSERDILEKWNIEIAYNENKSNNTEEKNCKDELVSKMANLLEIEV